jgi:hypothetical protein
MESYSSEDIEIGISYTPPDYCSNCGEAYPWTNAKLEAAQQVIDLEKDLTDEDKNNLKSCIKAIISNTPKTVVAAITFKRITSKMCEESAKALKEILDIGPETTKKAIGDVSATKNGKF